MNLPRILLTGLVASGSTCTLAAPATSPAMPPVQIGAEGSAATADLYRQAFTALDVLSEEDRGRLGLCGKDGCWVVTTPMDAAARDLLARLDKMLRLVNQAAQSPPPSWTADGDVDRMIEVANRLPTVASLAVLHARRCFADGKPDAGLEALLTALTVSRHAGAAQPNLMLNMVEAAASRPAVEALALELPSLPRHLLDTLPARLDKLPPSPTTKQLVEGEYRFAKATAVRQGFAALAMAHTLQRYYQEIAAAGELPPDRFAAKVDELSKAQSANPWVGIIAPQFKKMRELTAASETKRALLDAAILIVRDGEQAVAKTADPFGQGPFTYRQGPGKGFELEGKLRYRDQPVRLVVGENPAR